MQLEQILNAAVRGGASDIILKTNAVPRFRFNGVLVQLAKGRPVTHAEMSNWLKTMNPTIDETREFLDHDFAYQSLADHRFRVNIFKQRGLTGIVMRVVLGHVRSLEELQMPTVLAKLTQEKHGLILVTGATGSGKSTTIAAMIDRINRQTASHIVTIEDPIEYVFQDELSLIEQREVGIDTQSFAKALRAALRQNPDVIMVGELRDEDTVRTALQAAETGHLVLSTMHTADAAESLQRILGFFDSDSQTVWRQRLAEVLKAVISQRLVTRLDCVGMIPAVEILIGNGSVKESILKGSTSQLRTLIEEGASAWGMQSFDQSLIHLWKQKMISKAEALKNATSPGDLELKLKGIN